MNADGIRRFMVLVGLRLGFDEGDMRRREWIGCLDDNGASTSDAGSASRSNGSL